MKTAHEIAVVIPEDHRLTIEVPLAIRSGPDGGTLVTCDHHEMDRLDEARVCPIRFIR